MLFLWLLYLLQRFYCYHGDLGPIKNFTTITLYTDLHTWNEADHICKSEGGKLLDITRFSLFSALLTLATESPWKNLPVSNGPVGWLGLHRRITPLGDNYYSENCVPLDDFNIIYWNTESPYSIMDGDASSFCVHDYINKSTSGTVTSYKHDYTRAHCNEKHRFYCQTENGPCQFEKIVGFHGDTSQDFSAGNDVKYPYESDAKCEELCINSSTIFVHPDILVIEECWGYTTTSSECIIHLVVKPSYFDATTSRVASTESNLAIKRCYTSSINSSIIDVPHDDSMYPNTTCGIPVTGLSTVTTREVFVLPGKWTWNDAFDICNTNGQKLLKLINPDDYMAVQQIVDKYKNKQDMDYIWLGLHEPDPTNHPDIRAWSDCTAEHSPNWDTNSPPSSSLSDTHLCVAMETATSLWYTFTCNTTHNALCIGNIGSNRSYSLGRRNAVGSGPQLGPYTVPHSTCQYMCSQWTYENQECWGFAVNHTEVDKETECLLYFQNTTGITTHSDDFIFFRKLNWTDTFVNNSEIVTMTTDTSILPKSCCDVTGFRSSCPNNVIPAKKLDTPTTNKTKFILHTTTATWNEANAVCKSYGGWLLKLDDVTKRTMIQTYINEWVAKEISLTNVWTGLSLTNVDDSCSLRWSKGCSSPSWTDFSGASYMDNIKDQCVAVDKNLKFAKIACNKKLMFVCETDFGLCNFSNVVNIQCDLGPNGATLSLSNTKCEEQCKTQTYNDMECWAASTSGSNTCDLFFYDSPTYCMDNNSARPGTNTTFKLCYAASVENFDVILTNAELVPSHGCDQYIPDALKVDVCSTKSSIISTATSATDASTSINVVSTSHMLSSYIPYTSDASIEISASWDSVWTAVLSSATADTSSETISSDYVTSIPPFVSTALTSLPIYPTMTSFVSNSMTSAHISTIPTSNPVSIPPTSRSHASARPIYILACLCHVANSSMMTLEEWQEWFVSNNEVNAYNTSRYRRRLISVQDGRTSTKAIGIIVSVLFIGIAAYLITTDIPRIVRGIVLHRRELYQIEQLSK